MFRPGDRDSAVPSISAKLECQTLVSVFLNGRPEMTLFWMALLKKSELIAWALGSANFFYH